MDEKMMEELFEGSRDAIKERLTEKVSSLLYDQIRYSNQDRINQVVDEWFDENIKPEVEKRLGGFREELIETIVGAVRLEAEKCGEMIAKSMSDQVEKSLTSSYGARSVLKSLFSNF